MSILAGECRQDRLKGKQETEMTHLNFSSKTLRLGSAALLAALLLGTITTPRPAKAQQVRRIVFAPIHAKMNYTLRLSVANAGGTAVGLRLQFLNAADLSPVASSNPFVLPPRMGNALQVTLNGSVVFVVAAVEIQGQAGSIVDSVQMFDELGRPVAIWAEPID